VDVAATYVVSEAAKPLALHPLVARRITFVMTERVSPRMLTVHRVETTTNAPMDIVWMASVAKALAKVNVRRAEKKVIEENV
jgi:hypothetical protein